MTDTTKKCQYCGKQIETLTQKEIMFRTRDKWTGKQIMQKENMDFCSDKCATHYQFGCEG